MYVLNLGSSSSRFLKWLSERADLVLSFRAFHTGTDLLLNVFFLMDVLLYLIKRLCLEPLVIYVFVNVKKQCQSMSSNPFISL